MTKQQEHLAEGLRLLAELKNLNIRTEKVIKDYERWEHERRTNETNN